jgi:hypothetical protein
MLRNCLRPVDVAVTGLAIPVWLGLWLAGYQDWVAATSVVLVPIYLAANRWTRRRAA